MEIKVGVVGATGYAGAELVRLLLNHPYAKLTAISSVTFEGQKISEVYPSYLGLCDMVCKTQEEVVEKCDVVFCSIAAWIISRIGSSLCQTYEILY